MILETRNLTKTFPAFTLGPVNCELASGSCVAILGANGAGKSTFFSLITGQMDASEGQSLLLGKQMNPDQHELKRNIGYLPQNIDLPKWVTAKDLLHYAASLYEISDKSVVASSIAKWDITDFADRPATACSYGMQKRIGLALATIHEPKIAVLDEPFSGLDLYHIKTLEDVIRDRTRQGQTTLLSTHVISFASELCSRAFVIQRGQMTEFQNWTQMSAETRSAAVARHFFPSN